jgi:hypothetical protein
MADDMLRGVRDHAIVFVLGDAGPTSRTTAATWRSRADGC